VHVVFAMLTLAVNVCHVLAVGIGQLQQLLDVVAPTIDHVLLIEHSPPVTRLHAGVDWLLSLLGRLVCHEKSHLQNHGRWLRFYVYL